MQRIDTNQTIIPENNAMGELIAYCLELIEKTEKEELGLISRESVSEEKVLQKKDVQILKKEQDGFVKITL